MTTESTGVTLGGKTILRAERYPYALERGANSFVCPAGPAAGRGVLVMAREDVLALDGNAAQELKFTGDTISAGGRLAGKTVTTYSVRNLYFAEDPIRLDPAGDANPGSAYLVELADVRHLLTQFSAINKGYNVRRPHPPDTSGADVYYASTINGASAWTWEQMASDIWGTMSLAGTWPTLPYTPSGTPEDFHFVGITGWQAIHEILDIVGCVLVLDCTSLSTNFSCVRIGADQGLANLEATYSARLIHDIEALDSGAGQCPATVRVFFPKMQEAYDDDDPGDNWADPATAYTVDTATGSTGAVSGTVLPLWDTTPAIYDAADALSNSGALSGRATEMTSNWATAFCLKRERKVYQGIVTDLVPGAQVRATQWRDQGDGWTTTVVKRSRMFRDGALLAPHARERGHYGRRQVPDTVRALVASLGGRTKVKYGRLDAQLNAGSSATTSIYDEDGDTSEETTVHDVSLPTGEHIPSGTDIIFAWHNEDERWICLIGGSEVPQITGTRAHGEIIYYDSTGWEVLGAGTADKVLQTKGVGADPVWTDLPTVEVPVISGVRADGEVLYYDSSAWNVLDAGSSGEVLTSGGAAAPTWETASGGGGTTSSSHTFTYSDFSAAATNKVVITSPAITVPKGSWIMASHLDVTTAFTGGSVMTANVDLGHAGDSQAYHLTADVLTSTSLAVLNNVTPPLFESTATRTLQADLTCDINTDNLTAGSMTWYILVWTPA